MSPFGTVSDVSLRQAVERMRKLIEEEEAGDRLMELVSALARC